MNLIEIEAKVGEPLRFPAERAAVAAIQERYKSGGFLGFEAVEWALAQGLIDVGQITVAEVAPSLRCAEACEGCPDSILEVKKRIAAKQIPQVEPRASRDTYKRGMDFLHGLGVRHFMFVGGTLDHLPELGDLINHALGLPGMKVSWFSDGVPQTNVDGSPSNLMQSALEEGWMKDVANHISMDYPYNYQNIIPSGEVVPPKKGRGLLFEKNPEYSRVFKSQYGVIFAINLINADVRRVVLNTTISPANLAFIPLMYEQVVNLQEMAAANGRRTEVGMTVSDWIWRPHQARGDSTTQSPASAGLQMGDMPLANAIFSHLLENEYKRISEGKPRSLYVSSGYLNRLASPKYRQVVVDQAVPYVDGRPEVLNITPTGDVWGDPQYPGPELKVIESSWGFRDRPEKRESNVFSQFQSPDRPWFPNIVTT